MLLMRGHLQESSEDGVLNTCWVDAVGVLLYSLSLIALWQKIMTLDD